MTLRFPSAAELAVDEAPCPDCIRARGLCHREQCQKRVLPQLKEPSWPSMIGEGYVCEREDCAGHMVCSAVFLEPAPRAGCGCHSCGQRRMAIKHQLMHAEDPSEVVAIERIKRRNEKKEGKRPRLTGPALLFRQLNQPVAAA